MFATLEVYRSSVVALKVLLVIAKHVEFLFTIPVAIGSLQANAKDNEAILNFLLGSAFLGLFAAQVPSDGWNWAAAVMPLIHRWRMPTTRMRSEWMWLVAGMHSDAQ